MRMVALLGTVAVLALLDPSQAAQPMAMPGMPMGGHAGGGAAGEPGDPGRPARLVPVTMKQVDGRMVFFPATVEARPGEQLRFKVTNADSTAHEFMLGTVAANAAHKAMMAAHLGMVHHEANGITLAPGRTGELVWRFTQSGSVEFACLIPGHYEAGMHGDVLVR